MPSLKKYERDLKRAVIELEKKFLAAYIPADPAHTPDIYQHDVKAYCVLAHAGFEDFVETVSLEVMKNAIDSWLVSRRVSEALLSLCTFYDPRIRAVDDEEVPQDNSFDALRKLIDDVKSEHSKTIFDNHGFSLKYLRILLTPVAINITRDARITNSLRILADARGSYAHTMARSALYTDVKKVERPMTPEAARDTVRDCLELCLSLSKSASKFMRAPGRRPSKKTKNSALPLPA